MQIKREHVKQAFKEYTSAYDITDEKVKLKIGHTYRVADLCERIAWAEHMPEEDVELAWLLGMLHDVGRFEQLRRYNTFVDADSVDHAELGADILFGTKASVLENEDEMPESVGGSAEEGNMKQKKMQEDAYDKAKKPKIEECTGKIRDYISEDCEDELIETAIRVHSVYRVPEHLPKRTEKLCHVLRDADKVDILRVNIETPLEEIYNTTTEELRNAEVTEAVMKSFYEHHATLRSIKRTPVDNVVGHISLVFELVYGESLCIVKEQGYLDQLLHFESDNPRTMEQFAELRAEMEKYLEETFSEII